MKSTPKMTAFDARTSAFPPVTLDGGCTITYWISKRSEPVKRAATISDVLGILNQLAASLIVGASSFPRACVASRILSSCSTGFDSARYDSVAWWAVECSMSFIYSSGFSRPWVMCSPYLVGMGWGNLMWKTWALGNKL